MATIYSVSDRKEKIISQIMKDERLTRDRREQLVQSMLSLEEDSDKFVLQDSQDPRHVLFPKLTLFNKQAQIQKLSTAELKQKKPFPSSSYSAGSEKSEILLPNEKPIFVNRGHESQPQHVPITAILAQVKL